MTDSLINSSVLIAHKIIDVYCFNVISDKKSLNEKKSIRYFVPTF